MIVGLCYQVFALLKRHLYETRGHRLGVLKNDSFAAETVEVVHGVVFAGAGENEPDPRRQHLGHPKGSDRFLTRLGVLEKVDAVQNDDDFAVVDDLLTRNIFRTRGRSCRRPANSRSTSSASARSAPLSSRSR